jgi:hypothetical protein
VSQLLCSAISSFSTEGVLSPLDWEGRSLKTYQEIDHALKSVGRSDLCPVGVELYLAMEVDLEWLGRRLRGRESRVKDEDRPINVAQFIASISPAELDIAALEINAMVQRNCGQRQIVGFATFLPEIARSDDLHNPSRQEAVAALANILRLGRLLRTKYEHPVVFVEAVAGSRFRTLKKDSTAPLPNGTKRKPEYQLLVDDEDTVRRRVLHSLNEALADVLSDGTIDEFPCISLELEPGPYFSARNEASLRRLSANLRDYPQLSAKVGFNLDISHWCIAEVPSPDEWKDFDLKDRICHAHISGHHRAAHFGDCLPNEKDWQRFKPWFRLLEELCNGESQEARRRHRLPPFSKYVSVEMEAAGRSEDLALMFEGLGRHLPR